MALHNFAKTTPVNTSIFGMLRVSSMFFADDGFGNFVIVNIVNAQYSIAE